LSQINQRITTRYHLEPLRAGDVATYIEHRLAIAGGNSRHVFFSKKAIQYVAKISKGIPRVINITCDHALLGAYANNSDHVSLPIMKKAAGELKTRTNGKPYPAKKLIMNLALLLLAIGLPAGLYFIDQRDNLALLKHNVVLLMETIQPLTDENKTSQPQTFSASSDLAAKRVTQGVETNIKQIPADKD
jgi:general secretion pathway protein A